MTQPYEEIVESQTLQRAAPGTRHELICTRLHDAVRAGLAGVTIARLLERRSPVRLSPGAMVRPDLALVTVATEKLWLAAEIVSVDDHHSDTVVKKQFYEELKLPRLWMIDPRYDNIEVYHGSEYGLVLKGILAGKEILTEKLLPEFRSAVADLFRPAATPV